MPGAPGSATSQSVFAVAPAAILALMKACGLAAEKSAIGASRTGPADGRAPRRRRRRASCLGRCGPGRPRADLSLLRCGISVLVDLHQPFSGGRSGATMARRSLAQSSHAVLYEPSPSCFCTCRAEMPLEWVASGRRPRTGDERHLRAVRSRAGGHRGLLARTGAFPGEGLVASSIPTTIAGRTLKPSGQRASAIRRTGALRRGSGVGTPAAIAESRT